MKAKFLGCLVADVREKREGFTVGTIYEIIDVELVRDFVPRFVLRDDAGDMRWRPQIDFEVVR